MKKLAILLAIALTSGCAIAPKPPQGRVHHIVLCWLKEPGNADHRERIIETSRAFSGIPGVADLRAGQVIESARPIVDDSFDVAITMTFASVAEMNAYIEHPDHKAAVKDTLLPLVSKILVYDFIE